MPFALVFIGLVLIVTGAKDTYQQFGAQVRTDFTGDGNFTWWLASIGAIGALGYIEPLKVLSRTFMALILIAMVLRNGGIFDKFSEALAEGPIAPTPNKAGPNPAETGGNMVASQLAAGILGDTPDTATKDVVVQAAQQQQERVTDNATKFFTFLGQFIFGTPAF